MEYDTLLHIIVVSVSFNITLLNEPDRVTLDGAIILLSLHLLSHNVAIYGSSEPRICIIWVVHPALIISQVVAILILHHVALARVKPVVTLTRIQQVLVLATSTTSSSIRHV